MVCHLLSLPLRLILFEFVVHNDYVYRYRCSFRQGRKNPNRSNSIQSNCHSKQCNYHNLHNILSHQSSLCHIIQVMRNDSTNNQTHYCKAFIQKVKGQGMRQGEITHQNGEANTGGSGFRVTSIISGGYTASGGAATLERRPLRPWPRFATPEIGSSRAADAARVPSVVAGTLVAGPRAAAATLDLRLLELGPQAAASRRPGAPRTSPRARRSCPWRRCGRSRPPSRRASRRARGSPSRRRPSTP